MKKQTNNLHQEGNITKEIRSNPWILSTFVLGILCLIFLVDAFVPDIPESIFEDNISICSKIEGTPAWIINDEIVGYGFTTFNDSLPSQVVDKLIEDEMYFIYRDNCSWCQLQIEYFNESWYKYVNSGLTIRC